MKKYLTILVLLMASLMGDLFAQPYKTADSTALITQATQIQKLTKQTDTLKINMDTIKSKITVLSGNTIDKNNDWGIFISLLPGIFFVIMLIIVSVRLETKFFKGALEENDFTITTIKNTAYNIESINAIGAQPLLAPQISTILPATLSVSGTERPKSSSRYLAIITGLTALIIAICMVMFYMYSYIKNPAKPVDFKDMSSVLISLLVGIAPYSFNKLSEGIKSK